MTLQSLLSAACELPPAPVVLVHPADFSELLDEQGSGAAWADVERGRVTYHGIRLPVTVDREVIVVGHPGVKRGELELPAV